MFFDINLQAFDFRVLTDPEEGAVVLQFVTGPIQADEENKTARGIAMGVVKVPIPAPQGKGLGEALAAACTQIVTGLTVVGNMDGVDEAAAQAQAAEESLRSGK